MNIASKIFAVILLLCLAHQIHGHTYLSSVVLNGQALSEGDCVRPHPSSAKENPIPKVTDDHMTCGWLPEAANPANRKCPIAAGSTIGLQWHHNSNGPSDDILDPTHKGPVIVYLAKSETGKGAVWFKIYEDGYTSGSWATDRLIGNRGLVSITIPSDIASGNYLLRGEILALHNAYNVDGIQPYVGCIELTISGSGTANPGGVSFPGAYSASGTGMIFDLYKAFSSYPIPGPALYSPSSVPSTPTTGSNTEPTTRPTTTSTTGSSSTTRSSTGSTPRPTTRPTTPTAAPTSGASTSSPSGDTLKVKLHGGTNEYWAAVEVYGGGATVVKVEIQGNQQAWHTMSDQGYAYAYEASQKLKLPLSVRVTSSSGRTILLNKAFPSFSSSLVDSGVSF